MSAEALLVGQPIPAVCHVPDMCRIFGIGESTFHRREHLGHFKRFELPKLGTESCPKTWSGYRIARHLTNDSFSITVKRAS